MTSVLARIVIGTACATLVLAATGCGSRSAVPLDGTVGPGYAISLKTTGGKLVDVTKPGRYAITVDDRSAFLNFHLFGPGVNEATSIPGTGVVHWTVDLRRGVYQYQCDAHASIVHGTFRVG